jgi:diguanylate cyclase (GGDEF)-like protein/PAS domain S-box-containing protein
MRLAHTAMPDQSVMAQRAWIALASTSDAVFFLDPDWRFTYLNRAAEELLGRRAEELVGKRLTDAYPDSVHSVFGQQYRRAVASGEPAVFEEFYAPLDRWFEVRAYPDSMGLAVFFWDVHERRSRERQRAESAALTDAILNALPHRTAVLDGSGRILRANDAWRAAASGQDGDPETWGVGANYVAAWQDAERAGHPQASVVLTGLHAVAERRTPRFALDCQWRSRGRTTWFQLQVGALADGHDLSGGHDVSDGWAVAHAQGIVVTHTDITDRVLAELEAARQARHDHLTDLPNRARLHEVINEALNGPSPRRVTLLFLDLDGFKSVNDSLGHDVGDQLLKDLATRLAGVTRPGDTVGRLGGDEFVVVAMDCDSEAAVGVAERVRAVLADPFDVAGMHLPLSASIGIATSNEAGTDPEALIRDADVAMYAAKNAGRDRHHVFTSDLRRRAREQLVVAVGLRQAVRKGQLVLHYQPVHDVRTGAVEGVEALMRWQHPDLGLLMPGTFIPLAEETRVIVPMGRWLFGEASRQAAAWAAQGLVLKTSVNISAAHLQTGTLVDDVAEALAVAGADPSTLVVELTETSVARDPAAAAEQLAALRELGVQVAIDDFGAGYSSLGQLTSLPADILKIDRGLLPGVDRAASEDGIKTVMRAVTFVAASLGMRTVAEGVETADQLHTVTDLGCDMVQGYLLARPLPAQDIPAHVRPRARRRAGSPSTTLA